MNLPDPYPFPPLVRELVHTVTLPGSKSITNRALILAALAEGETCLEGALLGRDTHIMIEALQQLGLDLEVEATARRIRVIGAGGRIPEKSARLHVGNAGTAARFLTALLATQEGGRYQLDGDPAMRKRPMSGLTDALTALGAARFNFEEEPGHFPFTMETQGLHGGEARVDASASSQILSALLLAGASSRAPLQLHCEGVRPAYVRITLEMREAFGADPLEKGPAGVYTLKPLTYRAPGRYPIEPDLSAASYFLALALIHGGQLRLANLSAQPLQGDAAFADVLAHHGLRVEVERGAWAVTRSSPDIQRGHREINFNAFSDTFLTYAAIAPLLGGSVRIAGIGHTRQQETDRIAGMAAELSKLGQLVKEEPDALTIQPKPNELRARALAARKAGKLLSVQTYDDHRFAMSFAVLASFDLLGDGKPWLAIQDPTCCAKTFPDFFIRLAELHQRG